MEQGIDFEQAWRAVLERDAGWDGRLVYAVRSTGIFCRPSCASRRPGREQVGFFRTPEEARAAGYRGCRRCRPEEAAPQAAVIREACRRLEEAAGEPAPTLRGVAEAVGVSASSLSRMFRRVLGVSPREYFRAVRTEQFRKRLAEGGTVTEAVYAAGYGSSRAAYEGAGARLGMTPGAYRRGGAGQRIGYTLAPCRLGWVLVAATGRGVCSVMLGDDKPALIAELEREFSGAELARDDAGMPDTLAAVLERMEEHPLARALPLDVRATTFERRVWAALAEIPRGETRSYSEVAQAIGAPSAVRAVAAACGRNPVAVVVPCHRVVGKDGALTGYRWGVGRKRALLALEGSVKITARSESAHIDATSNGGRPKD